MIQIPPFPIKIVNLCGTVQNILCQIYVQIYYLYVRDVSIYNFVIYGIHDLYEYFNISVALTHQYIQLCLKVKMKNY